MNSPLQQKLESHLNTKIISETIPPQGMDSEVFIIKTIDNNEYAIKYSDDANVDQLAIDLINENNINIQFPNHSKVLNLKIKPFLF